MKIRDLKLAALASLLFIGVQGIANADPVSNYSELQTAIANGTTPIDINADINGANSNLGALGGNVVINGNSHTISGTNGASSYRGITVGAGQTLTINNATISGFGGADAGAAINNSSKLTLNGVTISAGAGANKNNDIYQSNSGATELTGANNIASNISGSGSITNSGNLTISGDNSNYSGTYSQATGSTTVTGKGFGGESTISGGELNWETNNADSGTLKVLGGNVAIGADESQQAALNIANNSSIDSSVGVTINDNSSLNILGTGDVAGQVTLNDTDTWSGTVKVSGDGKLTLDNAVNAGEINAIGGTIDIQRGTLSLGASSEIQAAANVNIGSGTTLDVAEGSVTINAGDTWATDGTVSLSGTGSVTVNNIANNGTLDATDGTLNLAGGKLDIASGSQITADVETTISTGTNLNVTGGNVTLNSGDTWSGNVNLSGTGNLTVDNIANNGKLDATNGTLNLAGGKLDIASGSQITAEVTATIGAGTNLNVSGGNVTLNSGDTWSGNVNLSGTGNLTVDNIANNGKLDATNGTLNLTNGKLDIASGSQITADVETTISTGTNLNVTGGNVTLNSGDTWSGNVNLSGTGNLTVDNIANNGKLDATNGTLNLAGGKLDIAAGSQITADVETTISTGTNLNVSGGTVELGNDDHWNGNVNLTNGGTLNLNNADNNGILNATNGNLNLNAGSLDIATDSTIGANVIASIGSGTNLNLSGTGEVNLDADDTWSGDISMSGGTLNVTNATNNGSLSATNGTIDIKSGTLSLGAKSDGTTTTIADAVTIKIGKDTILESNAGNTVNISGNDTWDANGTLHVNGGEVNISGRTQNGLVNAETGNLNLKGGSLEIGSGSSIKDAVNTSIANNTTLKVTGTGEVTLAGANDKWNGAITVADNGSLTLNNVAQNGTISTTGGTVDFQAGSLTIGTGSSIGAGTDIAIASGTNVEVSGSGILNLDADDTWSGDISMSGGTLNVTNATNNGSLSATNGTIDIKSGTLSLGAKSDGTATTIADAVTIKIGSGTTLESNAGNTVTINDSDTWAADGTLHVNGGTVNIEGRNQNGFVNAESGNLKLNSGSLEIGTGSLIKDSVNTTIASNSTLKITETGEVTLAGANDKWNGAITVADNGSLTLNNVAQNGTISTTGGTVDFQAGSLTIGTGSSIGVGTDIAIASGTNVEVSGSGILNLDADDTWGGDISMSGGTLNVTNATNNGSLSATNGTIDIKSGTLSLGAKSDGTATTIADAVVIKIGKDTILESNAGNTVNINGNDTWDANGTLHLNGGEVNVSGRTQNGFVNAETGNLNLNSGSLEIGSGSQILADVETTINTGANLNVSGGGTVNLGADDHWKGNIKLAQDGILNLSNADNSGTGDDNKGTLIAENGTLNLNDGSLTIGTGSSIADAVTTNISSGTTIDVTAGTVNINDNDEWAADGTVNLAGGTLNISNRDEAKGNGIITAGSGNLNLNSGHLVIADGSNIDNDVITAIAKDSHLDIKGGNVELNANDNWTGNVNLSAGNLTLTDAVNNGILNATGGTIDLDKGTLELAKYSLIDGNAIINIYEDTNLSIAGGTANLNGNDDWSGNVLLSDGILNLNGIENGILKATGGELNLNDGKLTIGEGSSIADKTKLSIAESKDLDIVDGGIVAIGDDDNWAGNVLLNGGTLNYGSTSQDAHNLTANTGKLNLLENSYLTVGGSSTLADEVKTLISSGATLDVNVGEGSVITLDSDDNWLGTVKVTTGTLALKDLEHNGIINAIGGTVDLQSGNLKVGTGSVISDAATTKIAADTNLAVTGGKVTLNDKTEWNGNVLLASGNLTLNDVQNNGVIKATGGNLNLDKGLLTVGEDSYINGEVAATIKEDTTLDIVDKGFVQIDKNDKWEGQVSLNGGTLNYKTDSNALLTANSGNLNLLAGSTFVFENGSQVADIVNVDIQKDAIVNIQNDGHLNLDTDDKWNGIINISDGVLTTTDFTNFTGSGGGLRQTGGQSIFKDNSHIYISDKTSFINGGEVQILNNSSLNYGAGASKFVADTLIMSDNSLLNLSNAALDNVVVNDSATINGTNHLTIDIAPRDWKADNFVFNDVKSDSTGTINISDFNFIGLAPIDRHIKLRIFDVKSVENVKFDSVDKEIFTPIGWYDLKASGGGYYTSNLVKYNPQVFRGQVATLAMYNNQLAIDDMILNHVTLQSERFLANGQNANKYAINQSSFAPYQYTKEDGGLWFKSYANFEHLSMNQGLRVGNNAYGSILGADFPMVHLKNGWEFLPTAFIAYNGSHQHFDGVGMYQNGGQAGFMGTFMKDDFVGSLMAYGGGYTNEMNVAGYTDRTGNWFAGTAAKAAYNLHATRHFTVQPTLMAAYNAFGEHGWHTDFGTMHMNTSMLNGISVAPGVNLIYARESWSLYTTIQYLYNINDNLTARAGNVDLHHIEMKHGYIQYGFGATKTWKDRLNSFFQITFRNGGRTGVGFQLGFQYLCDWYKPGKKIQSPTVLNSIKMAKDVKNSSQEVKSSNAIIKTAPKANLNQTTKTSNKAVIKAL